MQRFIQGNLQYLGGYLKRFTETEKWKNSNYRNLPAKFKILLSFMTDDCDNAGVLYFDPETFLYATKFEFTLDEIKLHLGEYLYFFKDKILLKGFIRFQCGSEELSPKCFPHKKIIDLLHKHQLFELFDSGEI